MQNRYVGDVGDFGKHGLLRFLSGMTDAEEPEPKLTLGLIWYMHHDERHGTDKRKINHDGGYVSYLDLTQENVKLYGSCDSELWSKLGHLVGQDRRCVHCVERAGILPDDTCYYSAPLTYIPGMLEDKRKELRNLWFQRALLETRKADLVCVDPDNGIGADEKMYLAKGTKFVYMDDLREIWEDGKSLVVYHHTSHAEWIAGQVGEKVAILRERLEGAEPIPLVLHRGTARIFFVIPAKEHKKIIEGRVSRFLARGWEEQKHFERVGG